MLFLLLTDESPKEADDCIEEGDESDESNDDGGDVEDKLGGISGTSRRSIDQIGLGFFT